MPKDLYAEYTVIPGHELRVEQILRELELTVILDPSVLLFLPFAVQSNPRKYHVLERYLSEQACHAHLVSPQRRRLVDELSRHTESSSAALTWLHALT